MSAMTLDGDRDGRCDTAAGAGGCTCGMEISGAGSCEDLSLAEAGVGPVGVDESCDDFKSLAEASVGLVTVSVMALGECDSGCDAGGGDCTCGMEISGASPVTLW